MPSHLSTIKKIYDAFGRDDIPAILTHLADDVEWESWADNTAQRLGVPWLQRRRGKAGVAEFFQLINTQLEITEFAVLEMMAGANQVAAEFVISATVRSSGRHYRDEEMHLWTLNSQGKVMRLRHYGDTAKQIEAAGLNGVNNEAM